MLPFYEIRPNDLTVKHNTYEVNFPEHMHKYIEILYTYHGTQHISIEEVPYAVNAGEVAVIFPDIVHSFYQDNKKSADALLIIFEPKLFGGLFPELHKYKPLNPVIPKDLMQGNILYALNHLKPGDKPETKFGWVCVILSHLLDVLELEERQHIPIQDMTKSLIEYIGENFTQPITRESLANTFNVNKYYISHIFSERIKINLRNYLGLIRAECAATLIRTSDDTLTNISRNAGFDSQRTFNRVFQAIYGMSPREYRNNIKFLTKNR